MTVNHVSEFKTYLQREQHIARMIRRRIPMYGSKIALRDRADGPWISVTWTQMGEVADGVGRALLSAGVGVGDRVGIFSQNRAAWTLADLGILSVRGVTVPIYATNSVEETAYIVDDAGIGVLFVNDQEQYDKALTVSANSASLHTIVVFSPGVNLKGGSQSLYFADFITKGNAKGLQDELDQRLSVAKPTDLYTLIYTSGTTGAPKGAMLTHENLLASIYGTGYPMPVGEEDISFAFLPLTHVFERSWTWFILSRGAENHYCHNTKQVKEFFSEIRPHYMVSVPRVWEKIYGTIQDGLQQSSPLKKKLFAWALETGKAFNDRINAMQKAGPMLSLKHTVADRLVLSKIREVVGGRAKFFHSGGAPLNPEINAFFVNAGIRLGVGYGLTEIFPICVCTPEDIGFGTSGKPIPLVNVRIAEDGEIQAKSPALMTGYWDRPEASAETMTQDGWFKTGDIGEISPKGYIQVTDRIKEILITAGGKNISPLTIETAIKEDIYVEQAVAVGDQKPYIAALVVPAFAMLDALAETMGLVGIPHEKLVAHPKIIAFYRERITRHTLHLGRVEQIKRFTLLPAELTQEAGELTPTSKLKRRNILTRHAATVEAMYAEPHKKAS